MSTLRDRLGALWQVRSAPELALFVYLTAFAAAVPLVMRLPLPRVAALLTRPPARSRASSDAIARLDALSALAPRFAHPLVRTGCLTRGVTLFWFLRRAGFDVELRFGVDVLEAANPDGHCWLTLDGEPFLERVDPRPRFAELYRLPVPAS